MASPWINTFETRPANNQDCWIRVPYYYGSPVVARFNQGGGTSQLVATFRINNSAALAIPFYLVPRWKPYP